MNIFSKNSTSRFLISLNIVLLLLIILILFIGLMIESTRYGIQAEYSLQRVIFSISDERNISRTIDTTISNSKPISDNPTTDSKRVANNEDLTLQLFEKNNKEKPKIAILITGLGLSLSETNKSIRLNPELTLGFSPYSFNLDKLAEEARKYGHEVMVNLPLEPLDYPADDPGPLALITELPDEENAKRLEFIINQFSGSEGLYCVDNEKFTRSVAGASLILNKLQAKKKIFLYAVETNNGIIQQLAEKYNYNLLMNDIYIDEEISTNAININLQKLEEVAKNNGFAIGIANPYPITLDILEEWYKSLSEKGISLVPISKIYTDRVAKQ